ncbi:kinase-like domain-containing protein [Obelidium mucronatum]|nr:kinase-like domain-containing protein [Obelidium mucronatum]
MAAKKDAAKTAAATAKGKIDSVSYTIQVQYKMFDTKLKKLPLSFKQQTALKMIEFSSLKNCLELVEHFGITKGNTRITKITFVFDVQLHLQLRSTKTLAATRKRKEPEPEVAKVFVSGKRFDLTELATLDFANTTFDESVTSVSIGTEVVGRGTVREAVSFEYEGDNRSYVAKKYMNSEDNTRNNLLVDLFTLLTASELLSNFKRDIQKLTESGNEVGMELSEIVKDLNYVIAAVVEIADDVLFVEERIVKKFAKYQSNSKFGIETIYSRAMDYFSHHSWVASDGDMLVADIQGSIPGGLLTDPQILSKFDCFSDGNRGADGIIEFFKQHECSKYCQPLDIHNKRH